MRLCWERSSNCRNAIPPLNRLGKWLDHICLVVQCSEIVCVNGPDGRAPPLLSYNMYRMWILTLLAFIVFVGRGARVTEEKREMKLWKYNSKKTWRQTTAWDEPEQPTMEAALKLANAYFNWLVEEDNVGCRSYTGTVVVSYDCTEVRPR